MFIFNLYLILFKFFLFSKLSFYFHYYSWLIYILLNFFFNKITFWLLFLNIIVSNFDGIEPTVILDDAS